MFSDLPSAEQSILGSIIQSNGAVLDEIALRGDDFNDGRHGEMFETMRALHDAGKPVDAASLGNADTKNAALYWQLTDHAAVYAVEHHSQIVAAHGLHRRLQSVAAGLQQISAESPTDEQLERAQSLLDGAAGETRAKVRMVRDILPTVIERLRAQQTFMPSPWGSLNDLIGGFRPGAVYVIAARPGVGKTVIAAQIAARLAEFGRVAFSSLEMSEDELVSRLIAERLTIAVGKVKDNHMTPRDWEVLTEQRAKLDDLQIAIDDRASASGVDVRAHARAVSRGGKLSGVVVDYLQLMASRSKLDRHLQVAEFSRQLKVLAKDFHVPVIALSQLNRQSEARADKEPKLSDLRESGAIEQDADVVILLRREEESGHTFDNPHESLVMNVAKNRHGQTGEVELSWDGRFSRAIEYGFPT